jgi:hypothetical protein
MREQKMKRGNLFTTIESWRYDNDHGELVLTVILLLLSYWYYKCIYIISFIFIALYHARVIG